mmetsp:Transcript_3424/g.6049  ORF Transcript_3424/g.6049 Transcript_3424/m.6049 type:complete len:272 (+) Transcript_3424:183-998(+)|eukprot:CAMPEP_0184696988 /NCGR_PEP_ID=MMETSP0313-20130426/4124_1 /TAXON_ID=2792 /ORGANISM="Porphyridium aerugineum, Strain SAG 1380-2" /LENGTH=271 /DNA_ID=CAMNT_0027155747 /DNA_START=93 /DNA_END=908 /DNA_ORIENTATION=-
MAAYISTNLWSTGMKTWTRSTSFLCRHMMHASRNRRLAFAPFSTTATTTKVVTPIMAAETTTQNPDNTIDFSAVNVKDAGKEFKGMIFQPEQEGSSARVKFFSPACESAINNQINVEYTASYAYHALYAYFKRDTVSLNGFAHYFKSQSEEEREHAEYLMNYQNNKGGRVAFKPIAVPEMKFDHLDGTSDAMYAMDLHLQLEKFVYKKLMDVWSVADKEGDPEMASFIENMLSDQVKAVKQAADYVSQLKRVGTPHGVWHFDRKLNGGDAA